MPPNVEYSLTMHGEAMAAKVRSSSRCCTPPWRKTTLQRAASAQLVTMYTWKYKPGCTLTGMARSLTQSREPIIDRDYELARLRELAQRPTSPN